MSSQAAFRLQVRRSKTASHHKATVHLDGPYSEGHSPLNRVYEAHIGIGGGLGLPSSSSRRKATSRAVNCFNTIPGEEPHIRCINLELDSGGDRRYTWRMPNS